MAIFNTQKLKELIKLHKKKLKSGEKDYNFVCITCHDYATHRLNDVEGARMKKEWLRHHSHPKLSLIRKVRRWIGK